MKIYLTATALLLSACASGPVQKPCQDAARVVIVCDPFYADCSCNQSRDDGSATIAKPSKPKPENPRYEATPDNEPEIGQPGRDRWERDWDRPGGGHDQEDPGWRDRDHNGPKADRAEGKPDRHNADRGKGKGREHGGDEDDE